MKPKGGTGPAKGMVPYQASGIILLHSLSHSFKQPGIHIPSHIAAHNPYDIGRVVIPVQDKIYIGIQILFIQTAPGDDAASPDRQDPHIKSQFLRYTDD